MGAIRTIRWRWGVFLARRARVVPKGSISSRISARIAHQASTRIKKHYRVVRALCAHRGVTLSHNSAARSCARNARPALMLQLKGALHALRVRQAIKPLWMVLCSVPHVPLVIMQDSTRVRLVTPV